MGIAPFYIEMSQMKYIDNHGPLIESYLNKITQVLDKALMCHHRTLAIRVDLHIPDNKVVDDIPDEGVFAKIDPAVISRFFDSLKAQIKAHQEKILREGKRVYRCTLRYMWAMEYGEGSEKIHYHLVLFVNKDTFAYPSSYRKEHGNLASKIMKAWNSALDVPYPDYKSLIHFPENCFYHLDYKKTFSENPFKKIIYRTSYLAKLKKNAYLKADVHLVAVRNN